MTKLDTLLVYHWHGWKGFLISHLVTDHCCIEAQYDDQFSALERQITPNTRGVLMQINLSNSNYFPAARQALIRNCLAHGIAVFNEEVTDIRKRHLHQLLSDIQLPSLKAAVNGDPYEKLFVKSNLNWGGEPEKRLPKKLCHLCDREQASIIRSWNGYFTIRRGNIPESLWCDETVVIETYIQNREECFYRVYGFGNSMIAIQAFNPGLIKKVNHQARDRTVRFDRRDLLAGASCGLPEALTATLKAFVAGYPLLYFCLDIVYNDAGQFFVIDLNLTPYAGIEQQDSAALDFLRCGVASFISKNSNEGVGVA